MKSGKRERKKSVQNKNAKSIYLPVKGAALRVRSSVGFVVHVERAGGVSWVAQLRFGARREALDGERRRRDQDKVHHALVKSLRGKARKQAQKQRTGKAEKKSGKTALIHNVCLRVEHAALRVRSSVGFVVHVERAGGVSWVAQLRFGARREALDGERRRRDQDKVHHALVKSLRGKARKQAQKQRTGKAEKKSGKTALIHNVCLRVEHAALFFFKCMILYLD